MEDAHQLGLQMGNYKVYRILSKEESLGTVEIVIVAYCCLFLVNHVNVVDTITRPISITFQSWPSSIGCR